jgi:23S rRNA pseudouridine1911/1915/1917 synthase
MRVDLYAAEKVPSSSRSQIKRLIESGLVMINGRPCKAAAIVAFGDVVSIEIPPLALPSCGAEDIPLDVIYEDADIIVVNKPAGMVVHPAHGHPSGTLVNALLSHCKDLSGIGGELRAGVVHRLDAGTSGAIVAAKNDEAHRLLAAQFKARTVEKIYAALVFGIVKGDSGAIDKPIGRSIGDRKKISARTRKAREALTEWKVIERLCGALSFLEIRLRTGRTHQIRVHFAEAGHPLVGDATYGGVKRAKGISQGPLADVVANFSRPALHSLRLAIDHPATHARIKFIAPLPRDLEDLLYQIRLLDGKKGRR